MEFYNTTTQEAMVLQRKMTTKHMKLQLLQYHILITTELYKISKSWCNALVPDR